MKKARIDIFCSLFFLFLSVFLWFLTPYAIQISSIHTAGYDWLNSRFFPKFLAVIIGLASIAYFGESYSKYKKEELKSSEMIIIWTEEMKALLLLLFLLLYALTFKFLGYFLSTFIITTVTFYYLGGRKWYHFLTIYGVGYLAYFIFEKILMVQLP